MYDEEEKIEIVIHSMQHINVWSKMSQRYAWITIACVNYNYSDYEHTNTMYMLKRQ